MERRELQFALILGLTAHPVGALCSLVVNGRGDPSVGGYLFASAGVLLPLLVAALIATSLRPYRERWPALQWFVRTFALAELVLQLAAQFVAFQQAHSDAQGGLLFLFLPIYAHGVAVLAGAVGGLTAAIVGRDARTGA